MAIRRNAKLIGKQRQSARIKDAPARQERQAARARALYRLDEGNPPITRPYDWDDWEKMDKMQGLDDGR